MERPYLNVTLGVRSYIFLSFESVKTAKKLWREGNTTAEFFILTRAWSKEENRRHTRLPVTPPLLRWSPWRARAGVHLRHGLPLHEKNLASDKLIDTQLFLHLKSKWKNQTGIIPARKDRKICLVCTTTSCEFFTANQNRQKNEDYIRTDVAQ